MSPLLLAAQKAAAPTNGTEVLQRMHDAYAGKWYNTLTFTQRTIRTSGPAAKPDTSTWYESLKGKWLRIDIGTPPAPSGVLYTADSSISIRNGVAGAPRAAGNEFLPLIMGVYIQPMSETLRQINLYGFDLSKVTTLETEGRPVIVVGTADRNDSTSAQFWVDSERWVVMRVRGSLKGAPAADIHLRGYEKAGNGWLATRVSMQLAGGRSQVEEYYDWNVTRALPDALFDPAQWKTAPHWAAPH